MSRSDWHEAIEEIKRRTSLVSLIGEYVTLKKAGTSHKGLCPFHSEKTPSFHVHDARGFYHCFGCGASGDAINFLREHVGYSFPEAVSVLADKAGVTLPEEREDPGEQRRRQHRREARERYYAVNASAHRYFGSHLGGEASSYLKDRRGLTDATIGRFELGYAPEGWDGLTNTLKAKDWEQLRDAEALGLVVPRKGERGGYYDRFRHRVMFPVFALGGEVIGFAGRTLSSEPDVPKYVNSIESSVFKKGHLLYGLHQAKRAIRERGRALVVEGQVDVLTMSQAGFAESVAPMGTALTEEQCLLLRRFTEEVVLVYDGDDAGRAAAMKAIPLMLKAGLAGRVVSLPDGEDPDTFVGSRGAGALDEMIAGAPRLFDYVMDIVLADYDGSPPAAAAALQELRPVFDRIDSEIERDLYRKRLAQRLRLPLERMEQWLKGTPTVAQVQASMPQRRAPGPEREMLRLLLQHPEFLPFWNERQGGSLLTSHAIGRVLGEAWSVFREVDELDVPRLLDRFPEEPKIRHRIVELINGLDPYRDEAQKAFVELMEDLERRAAQAQAEARKAELRQLPGEEQLAVISKVRRR